MFETVLIKEEQVDLERPFGASGLTDMVLLMFCAA